MRDAKRPTVITIQYDKTGRHVLITDLSGDAPSIIPKDDNETIGETIRALIETKELPELSIAHLTVSNSGTQGQSSNGGFDITDLGNLTSNPMGTIIAEGIKFMQKNSTHGRK